MNYHMKASEDGYDRVNELANMIAIAKNPHIWGGGDAMPDAEKQALIQTLENEMRELIG